MVITLKGNLVLVEIDGKSLTTFDPDAKDPRKSRKWFEPKVEARRPESGYLGLQNHDPGDVVYFKEVSVRPLRNAAANPPEATKVVEVGPSGGTVDPGSVFPLAVSLQLRVWNLVNETDARVVEVNEPLEP